MLDHRERWRVAVHEAGHVIAAALGNVPIRSVTIVPEGMDSGRITYEGTARPDSLAGAAAELAIFGDVYADGLGSDLRHARAEVGPFMRPVWRATCRQMRVHRQKVRAVAVALLERQTLGVDDLYERVLPSLVPTATHPGLCRSEESTAEWAARVGANHWEPDEDAEDTLRPPQSTEQGETTCWPF